MCTIVAIKGRHPSYPLVVAANRDEFYARPSAAPRPVHEAPLAWAGVDLVKGGSWLGANEHGIFVAVTNQRTDAGADPRLSSRGQIVLDALGKRSVQDIDALLGGLDARDYNAFNLFYGDADSLKVAYARHEASAIRSEALEDGIWVLPNDRIGSPDFPKSERALALVEPLVDAPWERLAPGLARMLGDHEKPPLERLSAPPPDSPFDHELLQALQALCIHTPTYGTRSATLLALEHGRLAHYLFADGPPCSTPFLEVPR